MAGIKLNYLIAHPGKHHVMHLVAGCIKSGVRVKYITPFYCCSLGRVVAALPGRIGRKASGYFHPDIPLENIVSPLSWQLKKLISLLGRNLSYEREFDRFVANEIRSGKYEAETLVTLQDYMPESVGVAKNKGWKIWSDQILNQSLEMAIRIARHEQQFGLNSTWRHDEVNNHDIIGAADLITVPSMYCLDGIKEFIPIHTNVITIPYGADPKQFTASKLKDQSQVLILARAQSIRKGGHLLIQALEQCSHKLLELSAPKTIKVVILGAIEQVLMNRLRDLKLPRGLTIEHGDIPHEIVPNLYQQANIFVMPSLSESMSLACVEALHAGLPLVITKYCGIDGFVSGQMGTLVDDTADSLASGLVEVFQNQHLWIEWGRATKHISEVLSWEVYEEKIKNIACGNSI